MTVNCLDFSTLTVTDTAQVVYTSCTPTMPSGAHGATIVCEDAAFRYRLDGTAPTASEGILVAANEKVIFDSWTPTGTNWRAVLKAMQVIRVVGDGKMKIHWMD